MKTRINTSKKARDIRAAVQRINVGKAIERRRADDVTADAKREAFERNGLRQAWDAFKSEGAWPFLSAGFGAAIYDKLGMDRITALLGRTDVEKAEQLLAPLSAVIKPQVVKKVAEVKREVQKQPEGPVVDFEALCEHYRKIFE